MNYRTFHIVQTSVYLLVIMVLCFMIQRPYNKLDSTFQSTFEREQKDCESEIKKYISEIKDKLNEQGNEEKIKPYYDKAIVGQHLTSQVISKLYDRKLSRASADSLQSAIEDYTTEMLKLSYAGDTMAFRNYFNRTMAGFYILKDKKDKWFYNLLKAQAPERRNMLFSLVRSRIYDIERTITRRLCEYSKAGPFCCYPSVVAFGILNRMYLNTEDTAKARIYILSISPCGSVEFYSGNKIITALNNLGPFSCVAGGIGDHDVHGYSRHLVNSHGKWDTLPWSFQYRVVGKGVCLVNEANQNCYRNVPNPLSVSIPGYPPDKIKLWAKEAKLTDNGNGHWTVTVADENSNSIIVYANATDSRGHTSTVHAAKFLVRSLPQPLLTIDGKESTVLQVGELSSLHKLGAIYTDDDWPHYTITQYEVCLISATGKPLGVFMINGNQLGNGTTAEDAWKQLSTGAHIYLTNITARTIEGVIVNPKPIGLVVM